MNLATYYPMIRITSNGALSGKNDRFEHYETNWFNKIPTVNAWLADDNLQQLEVCSSNIGFVYTFRKFYKEHEKEILQLMKNVGRNNENKM